LILLFNLVSLALLRAHDQSPAQAIAIMVRRLSKGGFVVCESYRGVKLTAAGEKIAMPALRRYRLSVFFLVRILGYDWATAHQLSDVFEPSVKNPLE